MSGRAMRLALLAAWTLAATSLAADPREEQVNVVTWPPPSPDGVDLCRAPLMDALCAADRERRAGYRGEIVLGRHLVSRLDGDGDVEWLWRGRAAGEPVAFRLADGRRVVLRLPAVDPPSLPPPRAPSAAPATAPVETSTRVPASSPAAVTPTRADGGGARWREPLLLIALPALGLVLSVALLRRRPSARPRRRTSFVRRVKPPARPPPAPVLDLPLRRPASAAAPPSEDPSLAGRPDAPRLSTGRGQAQDPARQDNDDVSCAPGRSLLSRVRRELETLEPAEREGIVRALAATCRLGAWAACLLGVLREIEEGAHAAVRLARLPPPARREWSEAAVNLLHFAGVDTEALAHLRDTDDPCLDVPAVDRYLAASALVSEELAPRRRWRRHLLSPDHGGRVSGVVLALQYLLEAFPVEQLEAADREAYRADLRERLHRAGLPPRFHPLIGELAAGLGLRYRQVRYYETELGEPGYEILESAHEAISLSERVGYEAGTEGRVVVRLSEIFLFESATGAYWSGRATIAGD